jgi:hypothetical protein
MRGRDVEEQEIALAFNKSSLKWSILGDAAEVHRSDTRKAILDAPAANGSAMNPKEIASAGKLKRSVVDQRPRRC